MEENSDGNDTNVGSIGNSIEEDIKIVEKLINTMKSDRELFNEKTDKEIYTFFINALEHILSDYKRVLKENEILKEEKEQAWEEWNNLEQGGYGTEQKLKQQIKELRKENEELNNRCRNLDKEAQAYLEELAGDNTLTRRTIKQLQEENEELKQDRNNNYQMIALAQNEALGYMQGYEDGKKLKRSAVANIVENQQYYIIKKQIEKYETYIEQLRKELEQKDKIIDLMAETINNYDIDEDVCKQMGQKANCNEYEDAKECKECIKQYFINKAKEIR